MVALSAFEACKIGDIETLRKLENVAPSLTDEQGATCLHYAARGGSLTVVEYLVKSRNFSVGQRTKTGATILHDAAAKGNTAIVKWVVESGDVKVDDQDGAGITALHLAARYRHILTVEWLLDEADADASIRSGTGALPLHFAVTGGDMNCVKILVDENPRSINMQMNNGATPIYLACQEGHLDILKYLVSRNGATKIKAYDAMSCLHAAAQMGHLDIVKYLVKEEKCNPSDRDFDGATPLHYAASRGHTRIVEWLMKEGGARVALDNLGGSPLHNAAELGEIQSVKTLLDCGCDVTLTDNDGLTAAELADKCDQSDCAALIRGEVTFAQLSAKSSDSLELNRNQHLRSPRLSFPPPPPFPPEDLEVRGIVTNTASTNTSFTHLSPSPPLPPPPALPLSPLGSTPSTVGSPITPPSPIHEEARETVTSLGSGFGARVHPVTGEPIIRRAESRISVDSSASNFGVFEQQDAGIVHTVTAEIHKTPRSVPPTPRPVSFPVVPGFGSHNTTQESIVFSGSNSSLNQDDYHPSQDRKFAVHKPPIFSVTRSYSQQASALRPAPPLTTSRDSVWSDTSATTQFSSIPETPTSSQILSTGTEEKPQTAEKIPKTPYYETKFKQDFNTGTKSSFTKAKALFELNYKDNPHICPDNGEICTPAESKYYSSNVKASPVRMEPQQISEVDGTKPVANGSAGSRSSSASSTQGDTPIKSTVNTQGGHVTIISTKGKPASNASTSSPKRGSVPVVVPLRPNPVVASIQNQKDSVLKELQVRNRNSAHADTDSSASSIRPLVNGHAESEGLNSNHKAETATTRSLAVNGSQNKDETDSSNPKTLSRLSSGSSNSSQSFHPERSKHDLIADIQSAVSGTSSLSLRRAKGKGEGVSMVYQSKKGGANATETKTDHKPLTGQFDPKNFLDQVEKVDATGRPIPEWRRQVLARHAAEKAQKEYEEKKEVEDYESRFKGMPAWKRAVIEKREADAKAQEAALGKK